MRPLPLLAVIALAFARPVAADTILYVSASSANRIDAFRVFGDGTLSADPVKQHATASIHPRRLIARGCNLYVAERDRTEVFRIHSDASLKLLGATEPAKETQAHDIALSEDGKTLYVPFRRTSALASYPLDDNGVPVGSPASCVYGPAGAEWEDLQVANGKLYAAGIDRVEAYQIDELGNLLPAAEVPKRTGDDTFSDTDTTCPDYSTTPTVRVCKDPAEPRGQITTLPEGKQKNEDCGFSYRGHIHGGVGLIVDGTTLVVGQRFNDQIQGFTLDDTGNFEPLGSTPAQPTKKEKKQERKGRKNNQTKETIRYIGLTLFHPPTPANKPDCPGAILYGAGPKGRTDAFCLRSDGTLGKEQPLQASTARDRVSTPVRTTIGMNAQGRPMLYVAAGERDRVQAFRLFPAGLPDANDTPDQTATLDGSYPNDVVLVDISSCD